MDSPLVVDDVSRGFGSPFVGDDVRSRGFSVPFVGDDVSRGSMVPFVGDDVRSRGSSVPFVGDDVRVVDPAFRL